MDEHLNNIKKIKTAIFIVIAIIIIAILLFVFYNNWHQKESTNNFYNYLEKNDYQKNEEGIYTKKTTNGNTTTTNRILLNDYLFEKSISKNEDNYTSLSLFYKKDKEIEIVYQVEGYDQDNKYGVLYQKGTYKNGEFTCEIVTNQNFKTECEYMKNEAEKYETEINQILKDNNIDIDNIQLEQ